MTYESAGCFPAAQLRFRSHRLIRDACTALELDFFRNSTAHDCERHVRSGAVVDRRHSLRVTSRSACASTTAPGSLAGSAVPQLEVESHLARGRHADNCISGDIESAGALTAM